MKNKYDDDLVWSIETILLYHTHITFVVFVRLFSPGTKQSFSSVARAWLSYHVVKDFLIPKVKLIRNHLTNIFWIGNLLKSDQTGV